MTVKALDAVDQAGITYRQLDHWIRSGYIHGTCPGSGHRRELTDYEFQVVRHMSVLIDAGVLASVAAPLARRLADGKAVRLGPWRLQPLPEGQITRHIRARQAAS